MDSNKKLNHTNHYNEIPLDEIAEITDSLHSTPSYTDIGFPMVRVTDISNYFLDTKSCLKVNKKVYEEFTKRKIPEVGDIIFTRVGSYGNVSKVINDEKICLGQNTALIHPLIDANYLLFCLKSKFVRRQIESLVVGSTQKSVSIKSIKELKILLPSKKEISFITEILLGIQNKIELNRRTNETLEEIAKALFKSWFIDFDPVRAKAEGRSTGLPDEISNLFPDSFEESQIGEIPKNWEIACLDQITDFVIGGDWGKDKISNQFPSRVLCIRGADIPDLQEFGYGKMPIRFLKLDSFNRRSLNDGDIIFEISGGSPTQSTGRPVLLEKKLFERFEIPLMCSNFCRIIRLKSNNLSHFVYYFLKHLYDKDEMFMYETGTTGIKNFGYKYFASSRKFTIPDQKLLSIYSNFIKTIRDSSNLRGTQSGTLIQIRDTLLPKLISGKLRIPDAEKMMEEISS